MRLGQVKIHSVASAEQHADIPTKPLGRKAFRRRRDFLYESFFKVFVVPCECVSQF